MALVLVLLSMAVASAEDEFEIAYIPRPAEERPLAFMSLLFTGLVLVATLLFFQRLSGLKLNASLLPRAGVLPSVLLIAALGTLIALDVYFWVWGNLIGTVRALVVLVFPVLFVARMGLAAVAKARAESKTKAS